MLKAARVSLILWLLWWGCASPPPPPPPQRQPVRFSVTQVVLLPDPDGKVGILAVKNEQGTQLLNQAWHSTEAVGAAAPSEPRRLEESEVRRLFADALAAAPLPPVNFTIYFPSDSAALTKESLALFNQVVAAVRERNATDIVVSGHTDAVGRDDYNRALSQRRARGVVEALVSRGVDRQSIQTTYHGKGNPAVPTPDGVPEPKNRRVEITIR